MSRRLSKKSRGTALANTVALSATNLPKPESLRLDNLFARAVARQTRLRVSLLAGSALALFAVSFVNAPAVAGPGACTQTGDTVNCTAGSYPTGIGPYFNEQPLPPTVETINTTGASITGGNSDNDGITLIGQAQNAGNEEPSPFLVSVDAGSSIAGVTRDGIHVYSSYSNTSITVLNAASINTTGGRDGIYVKVNDLNEQSNDSISISNSGAITGNAASGDGIHSYMHALVPDTIVAVNTVTITNTAPIGTKASPVGGDAVYSVVIKAPCYACVVPPPATHYTPPASITVNHTFTNNAPLYSVGTADYHKTDITDVMHGGAYANTSVVNSGNLTSTGADGANVISKATTKDGSAVATVTISNAAAATVTANSYGLRGYARGNTSYTYTGKHSATGGKALASTSISNGGNISAATNTGIGGYAKAYANNIGNISKGYAGTGGSATAVVTIADTAAKITTGNSSTAISGTALAKANGTGYVGSGGDASATTTIANSGGTLTVGNGTVSTNPSLYGGAKSYANGYGNTSAVKGAANGTSATSAVTISNTDTIKSNGDPGIYSNSRAYANGGSGGSRSYSGTGGNASATGSITNGGIITTTGAGIYGTAHATASGYATYSGNKTTHGVGTGTSALANMTITNTMPVTTSAAGAAPLGGYSKAIADGSGYVGTAGSAKATTTISNTGALTMVSTAISGAPAFYGAAKSFANAYGGTGPNGSATGGSASSVVTITNPTGANITAPGDPGIYGLTIASANAGSLFGDHPYSAKGGSAYALTSISNGATITTFGNSLAGNASEFASGFGSFTAPTAGGPGGYGKGGVAPAFVSISNSGNMTSAAGYALGGNSLAIADGFGFTAKGGTSTATTTITNSGTLTGFTGGIIGTATSFSDAFGGGTMGGSAKGGTATATTSTTNGGNISSAFGPGIFNNSLASASATGYSATGNTATATTNITNTGNLYKTEFGGIFGGAEAFTNGFGNFTAPGGLGQGGNSSATVAITNGNATSGNIYNVFGSSIQGFTLATAGGVGYTGKGGSATAGTTIVNGGGVALTSVNYTAINGTATALADGFGNLFGPMGVGTGGNASATVSITNTTSGNVEAGYNTPGSFFANDILGNSLASAMGVGFDGTGGSAKALTTISNTGTGKLYSFYASGIVGAAEANASGIGSLAAPAGGFPGGVGKGGNASATVSISNSENIYSHTLFHDGIFGASLAAAVGVGWHAYGGIASATTSISNGGEITGDAAINGIAIALAGGYGSPILEPGKGVGGTATAAVSISNSGLLSGIVGDGIDGFALARAEGYGRQAVGGIATATTSINNSMNIYSDGTGISGVAVAAASAHGAYNTLGSAKGGSAMATVSISNTGNIYSTDGDGIFTFSGAFADAHGLAGVGGNATAITTVSNTGNITSEFTSISSETIAFAFGDGTKAKGGTAHAYTTIYNNMTIHSYDGDGIFGRSIAEAGGYGTESKGGVAIATTSISNTGNITSEFKGIYGGAQAYAEGGSGGGAGGTATATVTISNAASFIKTYGDYAAGIFATTFANTDIIGAGAGGTATATSTVLNAAGSTILTYDHASPGIFASATADADATKLGNATATSSVSNAGNITTFANDWTHSSSDPEFGSPGIIALANAIASGSASATSTVVNTSSANITTHGPFSAGIIARTWAEIEGGSDPLASATTSVSNAGTIVTYSFVSDGIFATSYAAPVSSSKAVIAATATTTVINASGTVIKTYGGHSDGIYAYAGAKSDATATASVTNGGTIITHGHRSKGIHAKSYAYAGIGSASSVTTVSSSGNVTTYGNHSAGIVGSSHAQAATGSANASTTVSNGANVITLGRHSRGVEAFAYAAGTSSRATIAINNGTGDEIITTGSHSDAVYARLTVKGARASGEVAITNDGGLIRTTGHHSDAVDVVVTCDGVCPIAIANIATSNSGAFIEALGGWHQFGYHAIVASGGPVTIDNLASSTEPAIIHGNVQLNTRAAFADLFSNSGTWVMQGNSNFGAGPDNTLSNSGLVVMDDASSPFQRSPDPATFLLSFFQPNRVMTLYGLENFDNSGTLSLVNGSSTSDRLVIDPGFPVYFNGTGNSTLVVNALLGAPFRSSADVLQVGVKGGGPGYVTGFTAIVVNDVAKGLPGFYNPVGIPVVELSGQANVSVTPTGSTVAVTVNGVSIPANSAGNFALANGPIQKGFFEYSLFYLPKTDVSACQSGFNCWFLASTPNSVALSATQLDQAANDIWSDAAGVWLDRTADLRDYFFNGATTCDARGGGADLAVKAPPCVPTPLGVGPGAWVRGYGDWINSTQSVTWTASGVPIANDVGYNQTIAGAQMGYDWAFMRTGYSSVLLGLMGGADASTVNFADGTKVTFQGGDVGAYATFLSRGFFADGLLLANWMSMDYTAPLSAFGITGPNVGVNTTMLQYGGRIDGGYRFQFNPWFFEPELTAEVVNTNFGDLPFPTAGTNIRVDDDVSVRGRLGGRIGTTWITSGWRIEPSIDGGVWETFAGSNGAVLTNNGISLDLTDPNNNKTEGEIGGMLNFYQIGSSWSAFVKGDYRFADQYTSGSVKGGMRYQWP